MEDYKAAWANFKAVVFKTWDAGFAEGLEEDFMLSDIKDVCADQNDGVRMDATVEALWAEWKAQRG